MPQITMDIADFAHGIFRGFAEGEISGYDSVEILDQNKEYSIVKQGYEQSLSIYDRILLNAADYSSDEVVFLKERYYVKRCIN